MKDHHSSHGDAYPGGLLVSEHGYTLELDSTILASDRQTVTFRLIGPDGKVLTEFSPAHEQDLHLLAVRRDTTGFQHVHPVMDESGTWSVDLDLTPGDWRIFADFRPTGHGPMTLGIDASVPGQYEPQPLPAVTRTAQVGEYTVTLDGELLPGEPSELTLSVSRNGRLVTDLQPYLAAYGHLVALRVGDLGYLHVHPEGEPGDGSTAPGPEILFVAAAPSAGFYRLYLDFQHEGLVRTAEFTVQATRTAQVPGATSGSTPGHDDDVHSHH
ncbi:MAG: hypothetical protein DI613_15325 [Kocuria rhizophila]|uniref:hypothetical protein n=1 Tax=Kocuria sp. CPCC 205235 TaxID=3073549 RepID=UPI000DB18DC1|nr:MAG: hypothetical protein DI613_15325 [Kocuria rhizophila]